MRQRQTGRVFTAEASCATGSQSRPALRCGQSTAPTAGQNATAEPLHIGAHSAHGNSSDGLPEGAAEADHMPSGRSTRDRAARRDAERRRRERTAQRATAAPSARVDAPQRASSDAGARRRAAVSCAWCGSAMTPRSRGPIPKWCSVNCRRRAWEQGRAAASGRSAVEVVERRVEVPTPMAPTRRDWGPLLVELARQLEDGRVYARDLAALGTALGAVLDAYHRRQPFWHRGHDADLPTCGGCSGPLST